MNCLIEALGLALPGNGTMVATHADRKELFLQAGRTIVDLANRYYEHDDATALPRGIATFEAFENAMTLDIAMGGSTNTVCTCSPPRRRPRCRSPWRISTASRAACRISARWRPPRPTCIWKTCIAPAASWPSSANWTAAGCSIASPTPCTRPRWATAIDTLDVKRAVAPAVERVLPRRARRHPHHGAFSQSARYPDLDLDREPASSAIRHAFSKDGGLAVSTATSPRTAAS